MMKYLIYAIKTELSNKTSLAVHLTATVLVIYFILQYFGSYRGVLAYGYDKNPHYILSSEIGDDIGENEFNRLSDIKGFQLAQLDCGYITGSRNGIALIGLLGTPFDNMMFGGDIAIEKNTDTDSVYVPYSYMKKLGTEVGEKLVLKKNRETGIFFISDGTESADEFEFISFTVSGTFGDGLRLGEALVFPIPTVLKHFKPVKAEMWFDVFQLNDEDFDSVLQETESIFGNVTNLSVFDDVLSVQINSLRGMAAVFFSIGMICIMFMYSYILSRRVRRFSVCSLCGASKGAITAITVIGGVLNYTVSFGLALLLGAVMNRYVFEPLLGYDTMDIDLENVMLLFFLFLAVYIIVTAFYVFDFLKNSAVSVYRRSE